MRKIEQYIPLQFSVFLVLGVLVGYYLPMPLTGVFYISFALGLLLIGAYLWNKKHYTFRWVFQVLALMLIFSIGIVRISFQNPKYQTSHFSHYLQTENNAVLQITKKLKASDYYQKYEVGILQIDSIKTRGKALLYLKKDSLFQNLKIGDVYYTKSSIKPPQKALNPHSFNYADYLQKHGIYYQIKLSKEQIIKLPIEQTTAKISALSFREKLKSRLEKYTFSKDEKAVIFALILGERQSISKALLNSYAGAGAIHILAVSGLHVGVLFLLFSFLLKPLESIKYGKIIKMILVVFALWSYALVTGLSASVVRAVSMFSFMAVAKFNYRSSATLQALISSFLVLVLVHPLYLFDVGFQMSYAAVLAIILLYPKFYTLFPKARFSILNKPAQLISLSLAATIGTLPLSLYYFHQFPALFILSNLVIIPFLGVIMSLGILVVMLAYFQVLPSFVVDFYGFVLTQMNAFIHMIADQEGMLIRNISFSWIGVFLSYIILAMGYAWWRTGKKYFSYAFLLGIILLQAYWIYQKHSFNNRDEFIVFHKTKNSVLGLVKADNLQVLTSLDSLHNKDLYCVKSYGIACNMQIVKTQNLQQNIMIHKNKNILIVDSLGVYQYLPFKPDIVMLRQSPRINLERLIKELKPEIIVADASNYKSYVKRWRKTSNKEQIKFHYTGENGAFVLK